LVCGFFGLFFCWKKKYLKIFVKIEVNWHVSLFPLFSLTYLYHWSSLLHKLLNIICAQFSFFPFCAFINVMAFLLLK
jgi:hypothetical protein